MVLAIICIIWGIIVFGELLYWILKWNRVSDFTYFISRPFSIPMPMFWGFIVRVVLIVTGSIALYHGITFWF